MNTVRPSNVRTPLFDEDAARGPSRCPLRPCDIGKRSEDSAQTLGDGWLYLSLLLHAFTVRDASSTHEGAYSQTVSIPLAGSAL